MDKLTRKLCQIYSVGDWAINLMKLILFICDLKTPSLGLRCKYLFLTKLRLCILFDHVICSRVHICLFIGALG